MKRPGFFLRFLPVLLLVLTSLDLQPHTTVARECARYFTYADYEQFLPNFLKPVTPENAQWDLNSDGKIDLSDYTIMLRCFRDEVESEQPPPSVGRPPVDDINVAWQENANFPNVASYCQALGYEGMRVEDTSPRAYGVYCVRNGTELASIDMNALCQSLNGPQSQAILTNPDSPYGWVCNTGEAATAPEGGSSSGESPSEPVAEAVNRPPQIAGNSEPLGTTSTQPTTSNLNVRTGPGTEYPAIGQISVGGGYFEIIGVEGSWTHIRFDGGDGWVSSEYLQSVDTSQPANELSVSQPVPVVIVPPQSLSECPSGSGPGGIIAGGYPPEKLTQDQRQWLFSIFGNAGEAPVGYGGQSCASNNRGSADENYRAFVCQRGDRGPGGILIGGYDPTSLNQDQRQWLFAQFGNQGTAPVGYGGEACPVPVVRQCPGGYGPGSITAGGYNPQELTQPQRQWLWEQFGHGGEAPVGYGGETCTGQITAPRVCPTGVGEPGSFDPISLTQQQRNELFWAFGHTGEAPIGYGGESCIGGAMTLPSFAVNVVSTPLPQPTTNSGNSLPVVYGNTSPIWAVSIRIDADTGLNIRSGPGTNYNTIAVAAFGGFFEVIGRSDNGWHKMRYSGGEGWVSDQWVVVYADEPSASSITISRQPNRDYAYFSEDGCHIGITGIQIIENALVGANYLVERVEGCEGYSVEVWSLGYPSCQIQLRMYGPGGYENLVPLPAQSASAACVSPNSESVQCTNRPSAPADFIWMCLDWYNQVYTNVYQREQEYRNVLEFQNWAAARSEDVVMELIGKMADYLISNGGNSVGFIDAARNLLFGEGSRADVQINLQVYYEHRVRMERYRNDPTYVNDSYVLLPQELAGDPQVDTPQFWNFLSNWLNFL